MASKNKQTPAGTLTDYFWHRLLNRPYRLAVPVSQGKGTPVVLLHGVASNSANWEHVVPHIEHPCRLIVPDLLGFGESPKPSWRTYTVEEHAREVISLLVRLGVRRKVILVGHSMGALIAVEIARQRPKLVRQLILCGMPIYLSEARERALAAGRGMYFGAYNQLIRRQEFSLRTAALINRLMRISGFGLTRETWDAFRLSIENTIMHQQTFEDIRGLKMPIDLICGRYDGFVMKRPLRILAKLMPNVHLRIVNAPHEIRPGYGRFIASAIDAALARSAVRRRFLKRPAAAAAMRFAAQSGPPETSGRQDD